MEKNINTPMIDNNFIPQDYLPDQLKSKKFYQPGRNGQEDKLRQFLKNRWKEKYDY